MDGDTYVITDRQWNEVNSALLTAAGALALHNPALRDHMIKASIVMDDVVDAEELRSTKPLSTYPEDREKLLSLCLEVEGKDGEAAMDAADRLADLVKAILEDEAA